MRWTSFGTHRLERLLAARRDVAERPPRDHGHWRCRRPPTATLASAFAARAARTDADTINRELSVLRAAIGWWHRQGWLCVDQTGELQRRPAPPDRIRALSREQVAALFALEVGLREKTYWRMLYETAARAEELLRLDVGDLDLANKRARVVSRAAVWTGSTGSRAPPRCCHGCSKAAPAGRSSVPTGPRQPAPRPWTSAR